MKTLLLLRHAKSSWNDESISDHDRPLNDRGRRDAPRIGKLIAEQDLIPELIVSSSAKRARKTAAAVAEACGYDGEIRETESLYLAPPDDYIAMVNRVPDSVGRILLVGHNPGIQMLASVLTGQYENFSTACLAHVALAVDSWELVQSGGGGKLENIWRPKELEGDI